MLPFSGRSRVQAEPKVCFGHPVRSLCPMWSPWPMHERASRSRKLLIIKDIQDQLTLASPLRLQRAQDKGLRGRWKDERTSRLESPQGWSRSPSPGDNPPRFCRPGPRSFGCGAFFFASPVPCVAHVRAPARLPAADPLSRVDPDELAGAGRIELHRPGRAVRWPASDSPRPHQGGRNLAPFRTQ